MQIDWWTLALQTINFLIVIWLLSRFLYRPVRRVIEQREAADTAAREAAEAKASRADAALRDLDARRAALEAEAQRRAAELHAAAEAERAEMLAATRDEVGRMQADARARVARERAEALTALQAEITDLAGALARRALADPLPDAAAAGRYLDALPADRMADLRDDLTTNAADEEAGEGAGLTVVSAVAMPEPEARDWRRMLRARFGDGVRIDLDTDPALIAGVELRFPHAVLAFSIADRLRRAAHEIGGER